MKKFFLAGLFAFGLIVASPSGATTLFGLINTGELYSSPDQGLTWTVRSALPVRDAVALSAGSSTFQLYLASASGVVYRSPDAGLNWTAVGAVGANDVVDLMVKPDLSVVLLTATGTLYRSVNSGATFTATGALTGSNYVSLGMSGSGAALYVLSATGEISKSNDNGAAWTTRGTIVVSDAIRLRMVFGKLYMMTSTGDIYSSSDSAATWTAKGTLSQVGLTSLTSDKATLIAGAGTGEVATSADGVTWKWRGAINQLTVKGLGVDTPAATAVGEPSGDLAFSAALPRPNPAVRGQAVTLGFRLSQRALVSLDLYDSSGRRVDSRPAQPFPPGPGSIQWAPAVRGSGLYFVRLRTDSGQSADARMVLLK